ncbi:MAG: hypothetical protein SNJ68_06085 [Cyanobacteriota bacterium]
MAHTQSLTLSRRAMVALLLLIASFATLVPGGPIETRDFSQMDPVIFWGFNVLLIGMGLAGMSLCFWLWQARNFALWGSIGLGWGYLTIYVLDWVHIFPPSPDPIGLSLMIVEIFGFICCVYLLVFAHLALYRR